MPYFNIVNPDAKNPWRSANELLREILESPIIDGAESIPRRDSHYGRASKIS